MQKTAWLVAVGVLAAGATGAALCSLATARPQPAQTTAKKSTSAHTHAATSPYDRTLLRPSLLTRRAPATYKVKFTTTKGDFVISVTRAWAPLGADRFYNLARHHFYDNASFFRVLKGFVVQWGISAYPVVSAAWSHAPIKDDPAVQSNLRGYVTFAMSGPNSRTTQLFINLGNNQRLDGMGFSVFGQVTEGMDVVDALYSGYGEGAPDGHGPAQDQIEGNGKSYLDKDFPLLDSIKTTTLILPETAEPSPKPAAPAKQPR